LNKHGDLDLGKLEEIMDPEASRRLAVAANRLSQDEIKRILEAETPKTRTLLFPQIREHADLLTTSFDLIDESHREAGQKLVDWITARYRPGHSLDIVVICTGNSRRSILGAAMGNIAAAYYGLPDVRFHSGGTAPSACNRRAVAALKEIGVQVEPTGRDAPRGEPATPNPVYRVRWGSSPEANGPGLETEEFSKRYDDPANPQTDFAALMVCGEADAFCPVVKGSALRLSMPYLDPKIYDDGALESLNYAERRDDMGRLMLSVLMQSRNRLAHSAKQ
jgi:arsenate reductase (thioredoxin)